MKGKTFQELYRDYIDLGGKIATLYRLKECLEHYHRHTEFYKMICEEVTMYSQMLDKFNKSIYEKEDTR